VLDRMPKEIFKNTSPHVIAIMYQKNLFLLLTNLCEHG